MGVYVPPQTARGGEEGASGLVAGRVLADVMLCSRYLRAS